MDEIFLGSLNYAVNGLTLILASKLTDVSVSKAEF